MVRRSNISDFATDMGVNGEEESKITWEFGKVLQTHDAYDRGGGLLSIFFPSIGNQTQN